MRYPGPRGRTERPRPHSPDAVPPSPDDCAQARAAAAMWAATVLADPNTVVVDTETTTSADRGRVVEVAVLNTTGEPLIDTRVDPGVPIDPEAAAIHGITPADLAAAPPFTAIADELTLHLAGRTAVAWNAPFDQRVLTGEYARLHNSAAAGAAWSDRTAWACAMRHHAAWRGQWNTDRGTWAWARLADVGAGDHTAAGDCRALLRVLTAMAQTADDGERQDHEHLRTQTPGPRRSVRLRLESAERADILAVAEALRTGTARLDYIDAPRPGRKGGHLAYGQLSTGPGHTEDPRP